MFDRMKNDRRRKFMEIIKKKRRQFLLSVLAICFLCFPAFAAEGVKNSKKENTVNNTTKQVMVELEAVAEEKDFFKPNETAGYALTLKNKLGPSWIRVKFDLSGKNIEGKFTDKDLKIQDGWVKRGDYFYYTKKAEAYTDYLVVDGIWIPDISGALSIDKQYTKNEKDKSASVTVSVYGEAIQYDSITPDFSKEKPWEGQKPQHSTHTSGTSPRIKKSTDMGSVHLYSSPQERGTVSTGSWELINEENHIWKYRGKDGSYAKDGWIYVYNPYSQEEEKYSWFHFDKDGIMTYGWYKAEERIWYYCHSVSDGNLGKLIKGWHEDVQDGKKYFLDRKTGIMLSGWQEVDGDEYYFATYEEIPQQTWIWKVFGDSNLGEWIYEQLGYRSYGSMYVNEKTPDGQWVDKNGKK